MSPKVKAVSARNEDDSYTIFINSILNYEQQCKSYKHELNHIKRNDFDKHDVNKIELQARME